MSFNPGGSGGSSSIAGSTDVALSNVQNDQTLAYSSSSDKWENSDTAGGGAPPSQVSATVVYGDGAVPARPSGYARVVWVGAADPDENAGDFDVWEQTA